MSVHRFHLAPAECRGETLTLREGEARHARQVLRVGVGELVTVLDGAGIEVAAEVRSVGKATVELAVRERRVRPGLPYRVTLFQGITKGPSMDWIVQKATELGVRRLVPVQADRSVPQLGNAGDAARRVARWRLLAIEAMKQCGSAWLPEIGMPLDVEGALGAGGAEGLALVGSFEPAARHPRQWFEAWRVERGEPAREVAVWVGPEGDYTPAERAALRAAGVRPITLGPLVLRSETAAVYCLSVLACELQAPGTGQ